jgi:hypothetical protein
VPAVGSRFLIEAGLILAVAVVAGVEGLGTAWIIGSVAAAWFAIAVVEIPVWAVRRGRGSRTQPLSEADADAEPTAPTVSVPPHPRPPSAPEPVREPPQLTSVPAPQPGPVVEREAEPVPAVETTNVLPFTSPNHAPREWNLWELERAARDHIGDDLARVEERSYLLMYLREFAGPDGVLPADFDGLVRDAFGDVLHSVGA